MLLKTILKTKLKGTHCLTLRSQALQPVQSKTLCLHMCTCPSASDGAITATSLCKQWGHNRMQGRCRM